MARFTDLPVELMMQIVGYWSDSVRELSSFSRCCRFMHYLTFDQLFSSAFKSRSREVSPRLVFMYLGFHAIKHNSKNIAQWLCHHELSMELNG